MKTKLEMAHDWMMKHDDGSMSVEVVVFKAWKYADAMQAEADKREKEEAEQKRKAVREMLNADNTFLEKEGQHFDDVANQKRTPKVSRFERSDAVKEVLSRAENMGIIKPKANKEWQPDWSQAPESDVVAWDINKHGQARWIANDNGYYLAPSFNYQGDWRNSLRKRPQ